MSAHALEHAAKEIVVEDELESFFHVLLFFAIRFLPNNCDNVASFMNSYFDDYSTVNTIFTCGTFKMLCMVDGSIKLRRGGNANLAAKELCFMTSSTPGNISSAAAANSKPHPVDEILKTVLEWLRAHYAITDREGLFRGPSTSAAPALNPEVEAEDESDEEEEGEEDDNDYLEPTAYEDAGPVREYSSKAATKEWWEEQERLAKNLRTHNAFVDLLEEYVWKRKWPKRDKVEDQLVKGSNPNAKMPSDQVKKGGSVDENGGSALSSKRKSGEMDAPAQQGRPKRSKSGNTSVMPRRDE
ncbi:hypothetical protein C8Q77DRAFT_1143927 [Trametes polyzona]|nr:hypothetical protein C8Q77DRAFT_1143927 [Trametes polyzona]